MRRVLSLTSIKNIKHPYFVGWIVLVAFLGIWGTLAGPSWNPQPLTAVLIPETDDTTIGSPHSRTPIGEYAVDTSIVDIQLSDSHVIHATVRRPRGYEGAAPAMLFIHGTGTQSHTSFDREAHALTSSGIITLVPEKRIDDYSLTHRDYEKLADDFSDVFDYLVSLDGVDRQRSGIYAVSEGCFIAPIVATTNPSVTYVALVSAPVLPIREQGALAADTYLRTLEVPTKILGAIPRLIGQNFSTGVFDYIDFDVSVYQKRMTQPILMAYGTGDISMPIIQAPLSLIDDVKEAGNEDVTIRYYGKADHGLQIDGDVLLLSAMQDISDWVAGLPDTAHSTPHIAGAQPTQTYVANKVSRTRWFASGEISLYILAGGIGFLLLSMVASGVRFLYYRVRRAHRDETSDVQHQALSLARMNSASLVVIIAVAGLLAYMLAVAYLATNYTHNNLVTYGGWMVLRIFSLFGAWLSLGAVSRFVINYRKNNHGKAPITSVTFVTSIIAMIGQLILLMVLAYWGVFPSLI